MVPAGAGAFAIALAGSAGAAVGAFVGSTAYAVASNFVQKLTKGNSASDVVLFGAGKAVQKVSEKVYGAKEGVGIKPTSVEQLSGEKENSRTVCKFKR